MLTGMVTNWEMLKAIKDWRLYNFAFCWKDGMRQTRCYGEWRSGACSPLPPAPLILMSNFGGAVKGVGQTKC